MKDILKPQVKLEAVEVDWNSPEVKEKLERVKREIDKVMQGQKIDYEKLRTSYITI